MKAFWTEAEVVDELRDAVRRAGSAALLAQDLGVTTRQVDHVLKGHRKPRGKILRFLGFRVEIDYIRVSP